MKIGKTPAEMISNDYGYELNARRDYNNAIKLYREVDDQGSLELLTKILKMEEDHADWAEVQLAQIEQMGLENYLVNQVEKSAS